MSFAQTSLTTFFLVIMIFSFQPVLATVSSSLPSNAIRYTHSQLIANVQDTYVTVIFSVRNNPNLTFTIAQASFSGFNNTFPTSHQFFDVNPKDRPQMDLQAIHSGNKQYINLKVPSPAANTVYITVYNMDPFSRRQQVFFDIDIFDNQTNMMCRPCISGNLIPGKCTCDPCSNGHEGSDCSRIIVLLQSQNQVRRSLNPGQISYFKVLGAEEYIQLTFKSQNANIEAYLQAIEYQNQVASYLNVLKSFSTVARFEISQGTQFSIIATLTTNDLAVSIANFDSSPAITTVKFVRKAQLDIVVIVLAVLGGLLGLSIIISLTYVTYVLIRRRQLIYVNDQPQLHFTSNTDKLTDVQIQYYFPEFTFADLKEFNLNQQGSIQNLQADVNLALQSNNKFGTYISQAEIDCAICICSIYPHQKTRAVFCKHVFHSDCLISWFKKQRNCPYCREDYSKTHTIQFYQKIKKQNLGIQPKGLQLVIAIMKSGENSLTFKKIPKSIQDLE